MFNWRIAKPNLYYIHRKCISARHDSIYDGVGDLNAASVGWITTRFELVKCPNAPEKHGAREKSVPEVISAKLSSGSILDIMFEIGSFAVSPKISDQIDWNEFRGVITRPLIIRGTRKPKDYTYVTTLSDAEIDWFKSRILPQWRCPYCGVARYLRVPGSRILVKHGSPNSDLDMFTLNGGWAFPLISERLAMALIDLKPTGMMITPMEKMIWNSLY